MSSVARPRGPLPPKVYWRRRIVVLAILLAIIVILIIVFIPRGGGATPGPTSTGGSSAGASTPTPTAASGECDPSRVEITADTDKTEYAAGELPQLWLTLENKTSQPCTMQIGGDDLVYVISSPSGSGDEVYWTTADCTKTAESAPVTVTLKPGVPVPNDPIPWPRTRSTPGDCAATEPQVGSEGATFDFTATLGELSATKRIYLY